MASSGDDVLGSARVVSRKVSQVIRQGVQSDRITVIGSGPTSSVAALTSAGVANMHVNYVLLGQCDPALRQQYRFTMSGRGLARQVIIRSLAMDLKARFGGLSC